MRRLIIISFVICMGFLFSCEPPVDKNSPCYRNLCKRNKTTIIASLNIDLSDIINNHKPKSPFSKLPENLSEFYDSTYIIIDTLSGNLNLDEFMDMILIRSRLATDSSNIKQERELLILLGNAKKRYDLAINNPKAIYCKQCGGNIEDPYFNILINEGVFTILHLGKYDAFSSMRVSTFIFDKEFNNWTLEEDGGFNTSIESKEKIETTILTRTDFGLILFSDFSLYDGVTIEPPKLYKQMN